MSKAGVVQPNTTDTKQPQQNNGISQPQIQTRQPAAPRTHRPAPQQGQQGHISQPILPQHAHGYPLSPYTAGMSKFDPNQMAGYGQQTMGNPYMSQQQQPQQMQQQPGSHQVSPSAARKRRLQEPQGVISPQATTVSGMMPQPQELIPGTDNTQPLAAVSQQQQMQPPPAKKSRTNTPWTAAEEQRLKTMREAGNNWAEIAKTFPSRTEGSVKKHWYKDMHYAEFAEDESAALLNAIKEYEASKWKVIGQKVGKPAKACEQYAKEHFGTGATAKS